MSRPKSAQPTPGELEVLQVLWRIGPATVRQVMTELNQRRRRAYTSVMSLLNVMVDKGLLSREPQGRAYLYRSRVEQDDTLGGIVADLVERAFEGSTEQLVLHALEQTDPSPSELDEIRSLIEAYRSRKETT